MQKKVSILLAVLITLSMLAAIVPARGSVGNIYIDVTAPPSPPKTIRLGEALNLYFGGVTWSGGTIDLYLSPNGYAALNLTTDIRYGPTFSVADLKRVSPIKLSTAGNGIAKWLTAEKYAGDYSVNLSLPSPRLATDGAIVAIPYGKAIDTIDGTQATVGGQTVVANLGFMYKNPASALYPYMVLDIDYSPVDGVADGWLVNAWSTPKVLGGVWTRAYPTEQDPTTGMGGWAGYGSISGLLSGYQNLTLWKTALTGYKVLNVKVDYGFSAGSETNLVVYVDDITINGVVQPLEPWKLIVGDIWTYTIGNNWINGTVPTALEVPGGNYYVKAFDGTTAAVAVTDNYFTIKATFEVVPEFGPGQASIQLKGYALPPKDYANLSYFDPVAGKQVTIKDLYQADAKGRFVYPMFAPDLKFELPSGLGAELYTAVIFRMIVNSTAQTETDTFDEYYRGLKQVKGVTAATAPDLQLYGNNTNFWSLYRLNVTVLGDLIIVGKWFRPGAVTIFWDKATSMGIATANATHGWFNTTVSVPITSKGLHNVTIDDGSAKLIFWVNVIPTLILTPDEGPVDTHVIAKGYGFPAKGTPAAANIYNVTLTWDYVDACSPKPVVLKYVLTDTKGYFTTAFDVPHTAGGAHTVTAVANDTAATTATDTFTVTAMLIVSPSTFYNNGTVVTMNATGLAYRQAYDLNLDNHKDFLVAGNCIGDFTMKFVAAAGFDAGVHVATMYKTNGTGFNPEYEGHVLFTVNSVERDVLVDKLDEALDNLDEVKGSLGDLTDLVTDESAHLDSVRAAILAAIETTRGDVSALIQQLADIETLASTAAQQASSAAASSSTAATNASDAKVASQGAQATASGISIAVYGAVILSLIAALASIVAVITLQRKVAG